MRFPGSMRRRLVSVAFIASVASVVACGGKTSDDTSDACTTCGDAGDRDTTPLGDGAPDSGSRFDSSPPPIDGGPLPSDCFTFPVKDPTNPPIACGPDPSFPICRSLVEVSVCPSDSACMARAKPTGTTFDFRIGRLRLWAPEALLSLTALAFDPNVNAKCDNNGSESLNWLLRFDTSSKTLVTGGAPKSTDGGATFAFSRGTVDASALDSICPGFKGPPTPIALDAVTAPFASESDGSFDSGAIPKLNLPIFDGSVPWILPLSEVSIKHVKVSTDGACIGSWNRTYWCDGDTLGWTTGGAIIAKILVEDADRVPVKTAGCQSLCAILVNDASKTSGKLCRRGPDGKIPPIGDTTLAAPNDSFLLSATFAAYGVKIVP